MLKIEGVGTTERVENFVILIVPWGCSGCDLNIETHTFLRREVKEDLAKFRLTNTNRSRTFPLQEVTGNCAPNEYRHKPNPQTSIRAVPFADTPANQRICHSRPTSDRPGKIIYR